MPIECVDFLELALSTSSRAIGLGPITLTGFAVCAHKLIRARLYVAIPQIGIAMGFLLQIRMTELAARAFERVSVLVLVLWSWVLVL